MLKKRESHDLRGLGEDLFELWTQLRINSQYTSQGRQNIRGGTRVSLNGQVLVQAWIDIAEGQGDVREICGVLGKSGEKKAIGGY